MNTMRDRRSFLVFSSVTGTLLVAGCGKENAAASDKSAGQATRAAPSDEAKNTQGKDEPEVTAVEDLMREHGVIRRALVVYREAGIRLRSNSTGLPMDALQKTAKLIRSFAEDYHEKKLEEAYILPALKRAGGPAARDIDTLIAQHQRGREITDYILGMSTGDIAPAKGESLARTLESFCRMYEEHAAIEDTIIFPAWKKTMSAKQLDEMGDLFEDIEKKTFGKDGFDDAVDQIEAIEHSFGLELAQFTAPPAPKT
jgi:hemerythrin-like domain-containing protein